MNCYRVKDWDAHFEVSQSRKAERPDRLTWVSVPNKHDGRGYRRLVRLQDGVALYGAWHMILQVASKCPVRGTLADKDGPLTPFDIADKCSVDVQAIEDALKALCTKEIGWIEKIHWEPDLPQSTGLSQQNKTERNETERDGTRPADVAATFERFWKVYPRKIAKPAAARAWKQAVCRAEPEAIIAAAFEFAGTPKGQAGEFCPHPATWLNQNRWDDDRAEWHRVRDSRPSAIPTKADRAAESAATEKALQRQRAEREAKQRADEEAARKNPMPKLPKFSEIGKLPQ